MNEETDYDILIVGGGMVGASLAVALGESGVRIALVEAVPFRSDAQPSYDDRVIALAYGTRRIFEGMGVWRALEPNVTPIHRIHISDRGHFGATRLDREEEGVPALGYVAESRVLGRVLSERLATLPAVTLHCPATVQNILFEGECARVTIESGTATRTLTAKLVVAADGAQSTVRNLLNIGAATREYGQSAIITNVTPARAHECVAYERFTGSGPLAFLPMSGNRCSVVWTVWQRQVDEILRLDDGEFLSRLRQRFGARLGDLRKAGVRRAYPLSLIHTREHTRHRLAVIGNAAHTLHPVAGQGFNLGLRDVAALAEVVRDAARAGRDIGRLDVLCEYEHWRHGDQRRSILFTDSLVRLFSNSYTPLAAARGAGLVAVDVLPPLKHLLTRQTMGLAGRLPRLARGLPL